jgi:hypothetical protein
VSGLPERAPAEVVVGVYALDAGEGIGQMLETAAAALDDGFPDRPGAVVALDAGSSDGTLDAMRAWARAGAGGHRRLVLEPAQPLGAGPAISQLLSTAASLGAEGLLLVSAELARMPSAALRALAAPVASGQADLALPHYARAPGEGTLTTNLLAPFTAALYGRAVQQLVGGCLAVSGALLRGELAAPPGPGEWSGPGGEVWLTTTALATGARVTQVHVGRRPARVGGREPDVPTILAETVGPMFALMERHQERWLDGRGSQPVPIVGEAPAAAVEPERHDVERLVRAFRLGLNDLLPVWEQAMADPTLAELYPLALLPADEFDLPPPLWARIVSDFAVAHHERRLPRDHLYRSLAPLYLGRVAALFLELQRAPRAAATVLRRVSQAFEEAKPDLVARWR